MSLRVTCSFCNLSLSVSEDLRGRTILCRDCHGKIFIPADGKASVAGDDRCRITDRQARVSVPTPAARTRPDRDDEDDDAPRIRRSGKKKGRKQGGATAAWLAVGGVVVLALIGLTVGLILLLNQDSGEPQAANPPAKDAQKPAQQPPKGNDQGNQIPQPPVAGVGGNFPPVLQPVGQPPAGIPIGLPAPPAGGGGVDLAGTQWSGNETLAGYGRLSFTFQAGGGAVMNDAKETVAGRFTQNGQSVTITLFGGEVTYNGTINGQTMSGAAGNGRVNWTWNVTKGAGAVVAGPNPGGLPGIPNPGGFPGIPNPGGLPGIPNPGGFPGVPNPGGGPVVVVPLPGGSPGVPGPGGLPGFPNPAGIAGIPNPGGLPGFPNPGVRPGFPNPAGIAGIPNPGGGPVIIVPNPGGITGFPRPGGITGIGGPRPGFTGR